ncbi:MAG: ribose 5-phosphate isomerase B [Candidatus Hydrogenedentota bacterium]
MKKTKTKIAIGSDHAGFYLKEFLKKSLSSQYIIIDIGTKKYKKVDYPDIAKQVVNLILNKKANTGILICGTGIGMCITANRSRNIRAALCYNEYTASMARKHNDANILCLSGRILKEESALSITNVFLKEKFDGGRHKRRLKKIEGLKC